jgi:predicted O-linked N-acetylglucosamine transferase (SPINDLY family)
LRGRIAKCRNSGLFDTAAFTKNLESAYRAMWENWLAGEKAKSFAVKP